MINKDIKDITFVDLLNLQKRLDEEVAKPRENGFIPKKRDYIKICKSMIAEIIEFNEETENTHKVWKQKEFNKEKMIEESVDVLFFYLQMCNLITEKDEKTKEILTQAWNEVWETPQYYFNCVDDIELELIKHLSDTSWCLTISKCLNLMLLIVFLYDENNITKDKVIKTYLEKWQNNMTRIKGDWTK